MKIKSLMPFKEDYHCIGSYTIKKDTVVSQFEIQSKYSLVVIKLKNVSTNCKFNSCLYSNYPTPGYFTIVDESLYEVKLSPSLFNENYKISKIDFISDSEIKYEMNNDSIKSFSLDFNKYAIKINDEDSKVIYGEIEYYGLNKLNANVLFYNVEDLTYIFIMTPMKENIPLNKNVLYDYVF
ncbi:MULTISPECIES: hypothetical protein [unclassified Flavobacterium]|uniref:hypothetical protein n=1 Tax=unclassified Flavobacterium TaxID=196869 RepID=UPI000F506420|nr:MULTISPECIES: hypothetical protein [unclassified Flavobacterium]